MPSRQALIQTEARGSGRGGSDITQAGFLLTTLLLNIISSKLSLASSSIKEDDRRNKGHILHSWNEASSFVNFLRGFGHYLLGETASTSWMVLQVHNTFTVHSAKTFLSLHFML